MTKDKGFPKHYGFSKENNRSYLPVFLYLSDWNFLYLSIETESQRHEERKSA